MTMDLARKVAFVPDADIGGRVSPSLEVGPATREKLDKTGRQADQKPRSLRG
jgi:hypothetical protein